ncbi:DUF917 family protein [Leucobacter sp. G161]|uniref:S-methyl thiohydantoin desulfurase domain-containing protein n=1 Tax=Leucobacter sp. G161 TaxID=663704 RepID=UPI00073C6839|nr:DUF917 family protein [Leucobacter sp. G161]KUF06516.1 hypothetical protein AUL38_12650 [Leucobacter sp. G161]
MSEQLVAADVARLTRGAKPFASGVNSAALHVLRDWASAALERSAVSLLPLTELADDASYAVVTLVGSPTAIAENLPDGSEPGRAIAALERALGRSIQGILPVNTAGENAVLALASAAALGVALVDGDACGRVRPTVQDTLLTRAGIAMGPCVVVSSFGETTVIDATTDRAALIVPRLVAASGGWAFFAGYPATGRQLRAHAHAGTIQRYLDAKPGNELAGVPHRTLLRATITHVEQSRRGMDRMSILMTELGAAGRQVRRVRVDADEAYLGALADGVPLQRGPHELFVISESGEVLDPERCLPGMRVSLAAVDLPQAWSVDPAALAEGESHAN